MHSPAPSSGANLAMQFGSDYGRLRDFKAACSTELAKVAVIYPALQFDVTDAGLVVKPSPPHISRRQS
jgi:hypothetical protein